MKKLHTILFALGLAFLMFLIWRTGVGELWRQFTLLGWGLIPIVLAEGVAEFFHALAWRCCFSEPHRRIPLSRLFQIHLAGYAMNFLSPTASVAGEVSKVAFLSTHRRGPDAVASVLIGKVSLALGHLLFVVIGSIILLPVMHLPPALSTALLVSGAALAAGIIIFLMLQKHGALGAFLRWLVARRVFPQTLQRFVLPMERVDQTLKQFYRERPGDLARSVGWHLLGFSLGIFTTWCFLFLIGKEAAWPIAARIWILVLWFDLVTFAVPLNLGVLEGGRVVAFSAFGFGGVVGMTFGVAARVAQLFWAGVGLVLYALLIVRPTLAVVAPETPDCELNLAYLRSIPRAMDSRESNDTNIEITQPSTEGERV